jgi:hypothetical protein
MLSLALAAEEQQFSLRKRSPDTPMDKPVPLYRRSGKDKKLQPPPPPGPPPAKKQKKSKPPSPPSAPYPIPNVPAAAQRITQDPLGPMQLIQGNLIDFASQEGSAEPTDGPPGAPIETIPEWELTGPPRVIPTTDSEIAAEEQRMHGQRQYHEHVMAEDDRREAELPVNQQKPYGEYGTQELFGENYYNPNNIRYDSAYRHEEAPQDTTDLAGMKIY